MPDRDKARHYPGCPLDESPSLPASSCICADLIEYADMMHSDRQAEEAYQEYLAEGGTP